MGEKIQSGEIAKKVKHYAGHKDIVHSSLAPFTFPMLSSLEWVPFHARTMVDTLEQDGNVQVLEIPHNMEAILRCYDIYQSQGDGNMDALFISTPTHYKGGENEYFSMYEFDALSMTNKKDWNKTTWYLDNTADNASYRQLNTFIPLIPTSQIYVTYDFNTATGEVTANFGLMVRRF